MKEIMNKNVNRKVNLYMKKSINFNIIAIVAIVIFSVSLRLNTNAHSRNLLELYDLFRLVQ
mgnify:CR=1 FL=1